MKKSCIFFKQNAAFSVLYAEQRYLISLKTKEKNRMLNIQIR